MKPIAHKRFTILLNNELFWSEAFQSLTKSAQKLLMAMVAELKYTGKRGSKKHPFCYTNNGKIAFTEYEWKRQKMGVSATYLRARNQLIEVGFIRITYQGGFSRGDMNRYELLFIEGVKRDDKRWKRYPDENWKDEIPTSKDLPIGKKTRFKKSKNTLKNDTLNGSNHPNRLDPYEETSLINKGVTAVFEPNKTSIG
tara:strand:- start:292 stop:882 length:591 start_codon:yes stop_codon:yes gene_type:complete